MKSITLAFAQLGRLACFAGFGAAALSASASPIDYPGVFEDFANGGAISYSDVSEDSATDDPPLYGEPEVVVNRLDFDPSGFGSESTSGGVDVTDGQLNFTFDALDGAGVTSFEITEGGSYTLAGNGTDASLVGYSIAVRVTILEVDGVAVSPIEVSTSIDDSLNLDDNADIGGLWNLGILVELGPSLVGIPFEEGVTLAEVVVNNTLISISEPGTIASIDKTEFFLDPDGDLTPDDVIPEPATIALLILASAGLAFTRR